MSIPFKISLSISATFGVTFRRFINFLMSLSIIIQLIIITYTHLIGYSELSGLPHFLSKLLISSILTFISILLITIPNLIVIRWLNESLPWIKALKKRLIVELLFTLLIAVFISSIVTSLTHLFKNYEQGLSINLFYNGLIFSVCNLLLIAIYEAWIQFNIAKIAKEKEINLKHENAQIRFEVLKNQVNPHFMFNSLNVLSGLIENDKKKAQRFINEFSKLYRYVLQTIEQPLVELSKELDFVQTFVFLQTIRYGKALKYSVDLPSNLLERNIPPFAIQILIENACKHNIFNIDRPLDIQINAQDERIVIRNNYQPKLSNSSSNKLGKKI